TAEHAEKEGFSADSASSAFNVVASIRNGRDLERVEGFQEVARRLDVELRIARLDAQEETVAAGQREARHVEHRVIRLPQGVQGEHAEDAREGADQACGTR